MTAAKPCLIPDTRHPCFALMFLLMCLCTNTNIALAAPASADIAPDFSRIHEFAELANAAYQTEAELSAKGALTNYQLSLYETVPQLEIAYFIATHVHTGEQVKAEKDHSNPYASVSWIRFIGLTQNTPLSS